MSDLNVLSRTQKIVVDAASSSISIINAGPPGPQGATGEVSDAELTAALATKVDKYSGTGSPEGVVTAAVGAEYIDTDATNGAIKWIKTSGAGNTGWKTSYSDTGWRKIVSWTAGAQDGANQLGTVVAASFTFAGTGFIAIRRVRHKVYLALPNTSANSISLTVTGPTNLFTAAVWPAGFQPSQHYRSANLARAAATPAELIDFAGSVAHLRIGSTSVPKPLLWGTGEWVTDDAWPSGALPGVGIA